MTDAINPSYYQFSRGTQLIDITENLNGNGAQAVQYVTRSTRLDGNHKGDVLQDLNKALWFIRREIARVEGSPTADPANGRLREWVGLAGVPEDVEVTDPEGDTFRFRRGWWEWQSSRTGNWHRADTNGYRDWTFTEKVSP